MPRNASRKTQAEDLGATALPSTLSNSGAELRYLIGLFELRILCHCASRLLRITPQRECSRSAFILGDHRVGSFSKCSCSKWRPWANRVSCTDHDEAQQDFVLDFASLVPRWASLLAVQAQSHDDVRLFNDHFFLHLILSASLRKSRI